MSFGETAKLVADLSLTGNFAGQLGKSSKALGGFDKAITNTQGRAYKAGQQIGTGIKRGLTIAAAAVGLLASQVVIGIKHLATLEKAERATNAVIKSTKGVAGISAKAVRDLAESFESMNAFIDDKVIQNSENLLLTFTNIRTKAFKPALQSILDLNTVLGKGEGGLAGTTKIVAKALNDPLKGLTALGRVGVTFTKDQTKRIKAAIKEKDVYKAQSIILGELQRRFGGRFKAEGQSVEGQFANIQDAVDDLRDALAKGLLPVVQRVFPKIADFLRSDAVKRGAAQLGDAITALFSDENIRHGVDILKAGFEAAKSAAPVVAEAAKATAGFVKSAVGLFNSLPDGLKALIVGGVAVNKLTGGLVTNVAGGIIEAVGKNFLQRGSSPANPLFVSDISGGLGGVPGGGGAGGILGKVLKLLPWVAVGTLIAEGFIQGNKDHPGLYGTGGPSPISGIPAPRAHLPIGTPIPGSVFTGAGKAADDAALALRGMTGDANHAGKALDDLNVGLGGSNGFLTRLKHQEETILGVKTAKDPKSHGFHIAQRTFIDKHTNQDAVRIADAFAQRFDKSQKPFYHNAQNQTNALKSLRKLQQRFLDRGDTKSAARIGKDIALLKSAQKREQEATRARLAAKLDKVRAAAEKDRILRVTVPVKTFINGRLIGSALGRYQPSSLTHHAGNGGA